MEIKIKLKIASQRYPMTIPAEEEGYCRAAGKKINEQINAMQAKHHGLELEENLVLNAIENHVSSLKEEEETLKQIGALNQLIEKAM